MLARGKTEELREYFKKKSNITGVILFGSYGTEYYNENSDLDLGIVYGDSPDICEELEVEDSVSKILGTDKVDVVNLGKASPIFQYNAVSDGEILYEADYEKMSDFMEKVYNVYCDMKYDYVTFCNDYDYSLRESYSNG